jgi:signal transduction histidine kinase/PAS domain-containing protein
MSRTVREDGIAAGLFAGPGEMRKRCREFDWSSTPLGPIWLWPQSMRAIVSTMLGSRHPMFLWWGPELVQIFNDAYLPSLGKGSRDVAALGARGREYWAEIWPGIGPQIEQVMTTGEPTWHEDQLIPIERNGRVEEVWWTYGYSRVLDDDGGIGGTLVVCWETTRRVQLLTLERAALREAETLRGEAEMARTQLREMFRQAPAFIAVLRGPQFIFEFANDYYFDLVGRRDIIGKRAFDALPDARGQGFEELLRRVFDTGEPYVGYDTPLLLERVSGGPREQRYVDFAFTRLTDPDENRSAVFVHGIDVTGHVLARHEAEARRKQAEEARELTARLYALSAALSAASTPDEVADAVVTHAAAVFGASGVVLAQLSEEHGHEIELMRASDMPDAFHESWRHITKAPRAPLADVARTREPLFLESRSAWAEQYPHLVPSLDPTIHQANIVAPLMVDGRLLGVLGVAFDAPQAFDPNIRALTLVVAAQCGRAFDRAHLYEAERAARADAEAANRAKSEFLAVMSHELRTPLNAIGGYAELIELGIRGPVTQDQRADLARIQKSQQHLLGLINGVLNYARVDAGAVDYALAHVPLDEVLATCEALIAPQVRAKRLTLSFIECDPTITTLSDREKLLQIVLNLMSNAVKFTEPGGAVTLACEGEVAGLVRIRVTDTGCGIAATQLEQIFRPFVQVDATLTRTHEGTGLGLAISRDLARGMGGDLTVESSLGAGSTFTLTVPAGGPQSRRTPSRSPSG